MDQIIDLLKFLETLEWYYWLIGFFLLAATFGKKKEWEYEAKLFVSGNEESVGEIEIKQFKGEAPHAKIQLKSFEGFYGNHLEIFVESKSICKLSFDESGSRQTKHFPLVRTEKKEKFRGSRKHKWTLVDLGLVATDMPANNQKVEIHNDQGLLFSGVLFRD